jgi:cell division protein FtsB
MLYHRWMARLSSYIRREWLSLILGLILAFLVAGLLAGPQGPRDLVALRRHRRILEEKREQLLARNAALRTNVQRLSADDRFLERLIRRELGYARPNELVYKYPDAPEEKPR